MVENVKPDVGADLMRVHKAITRAQDVIIERCTSYAQKGFPDETVRQGFIDYVRSYATFLNGHHLTEDELAFPQFQAKFPDAPVAQLMADHRKMIPILDEINSLVEELTADSQDKDALSALSKATARLKEIWHPHIGIEEEVFSSQKLNAVFTTDEQVNMGQTMAQHAMKNTGPDYLLVPFYLYNLVPADRAELARALPPVITEQLIPVVWKEKWAPMKPFLLE